MPTHEIMTAIIIDDEQHCIDQLQYLLQQHLRQSIQVVAVAKTVDEGVAVVKALQPQLVFLDVQVHDRTGFDLLKQLAPVPFAVIFTTAFDKYAVQAFKFSAVDYLLKPVDKDDLRAAVDKAAEATRLKQTAGKIDVLFHNMQQQGYQQRRICIPISTGLIFLQVNDIIRCESNINYTTLYTNDKRKIVAAKTLKEFEEMLADSNFYRVHNSHLVNLAYISHYNKGRVGGGTITLTDGSEVEVATRRKDEFIKRMQEQG